MDRVIFVWRDGTREHRDVVVDTAIALVDVEPPRSPLDAGVPGIVYWRPAPKRYQFRRTVRTYAPDWHGPIESHWFHGGAVRFEFLFVEERQVPRRGYCPACDGMLCANPQCEVAA